MTASYRTVSAGSRIRAWIFAGALIVYGDIASAAGTAVGTSIDNTATVDFNLGGTPLTISSNTTTITVAERLDVVVTLQSGQVLVSANDVNQALLFTVTNTGQRLRGDRARDRQRDCR